MKQSKEVVLIGAGIMSATLAILLKRLDSTIKIKIYEMLDTIAVESSAAMNNAGTGHSGFCELNYTPQNSDGSINIKKAIEVAKEFSLSKEFWASLVQDGYISDPKAFINLTPHFSFVNNEKDVQFLKTRYDALKPHPLFNQMQYSDNPEVIEDWLPLVMKGRSNNETIAATKVDQGTDVNFESLTKEIINNLLKRGEIELFCGHFVKSLKQDSTSNKWEVIVQEIKTKNKITTNADFVFIGAGGGSIFLLEKSGIPEAKGFGGFPVGGEWLVCENPEVVIQHQAKVYGQAKIGAPPMSVPHLDTRVIDGKQKLLFGPFAVFSTKFLKHGSYMDLFKSLQIENLGFMTQAGYRNTDLTKYLIQQVSLSKKAKLKDLQEYLPNAKIEDWQEQVAGQRVQVIKKDGDNGGVLQFGTEIVSSKDGSIAALLGASPGASTSVAIMIKVIEKSFKEEFTSNEWQEKLHALIPSFGSDFSNKQGVTEAREKTNKILKLK